MFMESSYTPTKLYTDTLMEEVQSVVLEADESKPPSIYMHKQVLELSADQSSIESNIRYCFSFQNWPNFKNC